MNMHRLTLVLSLLSAAMACGTDDGVTTAGGTDSATGSETSMTGGSMTDPDTTVSASASMSDTQVDSSTSDPTTDTDPTTDPTTTTDPTDASSSTDPDTGSTEGSSTDPTDASSSSTDPSSGSTDTGGMPVEGYGDCVNEPEDQACIDGEICVSNPDTGEGFCSLQGCVDASDCPIAASGDAVVACLDGDGDEVNDCFLACTGGETCPDGMVCFSQVVCIWQPQ